MRNDRRESTGKVQVLWFDEQGLGPVVVEIEASAFLFSRPGPNDRVLLRAPGNGGADMSPDAARALAAALVKAAELAEKGGASVKSSRILNDQVVAPRRPRVELELAEDPEPLDVPVETTLLGVAARVLLVLAFFLAVVALSVVAGVLAAPIVGAAT
jgi:hypothetical protein